MSDVNLDLDLERRRRNGADVAVARVSVALACSFVKDSGAPTITRDCTTADELEREIARLKEELDQALERARAALGDAPAPASRPEEAAAVQPREAPGKPHLDSGLCVADAMTREVRTLGRNDRLQLADELMKLGGFRHVVVLDDDQKVAGVVSQRDLFYGALAWSLGLGTSAHQKALAARLVKDVMECKVVTVRPETPLAEAAESMREHKIGCLPVLDGGRLVGILTEGDFLALLAG